MEMEQVKNTYIKYMKYRKVTEEREISYKDIEGKIRRRNKRIENEQKYIRCE